MRLGNLGAGPRSRKAPTRPQHTFTDQSSHTHCPSKLVSAALKHIQVLTHLCPHYAQHPLSHLRPSHMTSRPSLNTASLCSKPAVLCPQPGWQLAGTGSIHC